MKILVVDDDDDLREAIFYMLTETGHAVSQAPSGNTAIAILNSNFEPFDLVISDYYMSDGDGLDLLTYIRGQSGTKPAFILITGQADRRVNTVLEKGAQYILFKPFSAEQMLSLIGSLNS